MNKQDLDTILAIRKKGQLTYTRQQMEMAAWGRPYNSDSEQSILDDVATINEIMKRYCDTFVEFTSFTEDNRIRYQSRWDSGFTGVCYTRIDFLPFNFPLGNYSGDCVERFATENGLPA